MKTCSQISDSPKCQQDTQLAAIPDEAKSRDAKAALCDDELEQVNAGSTNCVPTMDPDVLLGRHAFPSDQEERRP